MKLNKYIFVRIMNLVEPDTMSDYFTEDDVEKWIVDWYESEFRWQGKKKRPPMWLADWKQFVQPERSVVEQERCGIDEG